MDFSSSNSEKRIDNITKDKDSNIIKIIKGSIISIIISLLFLTVYAILLSTTNISEDSMETIVIIISGISILIGSSLSTKRLKKQGMINGGIVGLIYMMFLYILSSIILMNFKMNLNTIIMLATGILAGMIGGIIGINMKV